MYNIAKVAKGEILIYFNDIFDALCKVCPNVVPPVSSPGESSWWINHGSYP
jgi:vacuole morphology and inheritance protein 14